MARKSKRAKRKSRLTYIEKLDRLRTTYTPKTRARTDRGLDRYAKAWITRKWRDVSTRQRAARLYSEGIRREPVKPQRAFPERFKRIPAPKRRAPKPRKPPRIRTKRQRDTTLATMLPQPFDRQVSYVMRKAREGKYVRILRKVKKSPDYKRGIASSKWFDFEGRSREFIAEKLGELGDIYEIASAAPAGLAKGQTILR